MQPNAASPANTPPPANAAPPAPPRTPTHLHRHPLASPRPRQPGELTTEARAQAAGPCRQRGPRGRQGRGGGRGRSGQGPARRSSAGSRTRTCEGRPEDLRAGRAPPAPPRVSRAGAAPPAPRAPAAQTPVTVSSASLLLAALPLPPSRCPPSHRAAPRPARHL